MTYEESKKNIEPYKLKKGQVLNPHGRPKSIHSLLKDHFLAEHKIKISKDHTAQIIMHLLSMNKKQLIEIGKNEDMPFWISMIVKKAIKDYDRGSIHVLEVLWDRVHGKPQEHIEATVDAKVMNVTLDLGKP